MKSREHSPADIGGKSPETMPTPEASRPEAPAVTAAERDLIDMHLLAATVPADSPERAETEQKLREARAAAAESRLEAIADDPNAKAERQWLAESVRSIRAAKKAELAGRDAAATSDAAAAVDAAYDGGRAEKTESTVEKNTDAEKSVGSKSAWERFKGMFKKKEELPYDPLKLPDIKPQEGERKPTTLAELYEDAKEKIKKILAFLGTPFK